MRRAIPSFKPRITRLQPVAWQDRHAAQQKLYEAVTDYVRHGYNQAMAAKQRHIGFLMILMQRLVTSSTAAIRTTLEKRQALLDQPQLQPSLFETADVDEWAELDGQTQVDLAVQTRGWEMEKAEVDTLLELARSTEAQGTDAKAEAMLELIYKLQQEENDPELKVLIFTEFVPTQTMLAAFSWKAAASRSPRSTAAWISMRAPGPSRRSRAMCAFLSPPMPAAKA